MKKKLVSLMLVAAMAATMAAGCGSNNGNGGNDKASDNENQTEENSDSAEDEEDGSQTASGDGAVYYLNFKPEQADQWKALAETYTEQTGVPVRNCAKINLLFWQYMV